MSSKSIQDILSYTTISKAVQATVSGIPRPLPDGFFKSSERVVGNRGRYRRFTGERRTAQLAAWGAPPRHVKLRDVGEVEYKCLHLNEVLRLDPTVFMYLQQPNAYQHDTALDEVKRQVAAHAMKFQNTRTATIMQVLRAGSLYWDADGNLLPSSSGATETHTFGMSANNQNQLNGIIAASWALNSTDIPLQLRNLKKQAVRATGYELKVAIYGENVPSYFAQNKYVLDYLARNPRMQAEWLDSGEIPDGLFGFTWKPAYLAFFEDSAGTNQDIWAADAVTFTPEPAEAWWDVVEGSIPKPTTVYQVMGDAAASMGSLEFAYGMGGYGMVSMASLVPTCDNIYFDTFIPLLKVPDAIYQADVTP